MAKFYGTFMQKQAFKNHYVVIYAATEAQARGAMFAHFGEKFMTVYTEEDFEGQVERFNLMKLAGITVTDYGHGSIDYTFAT